MNITLGQPLSFTQIGQRDNQEDARYPDADAPRDAAPFFLVCDGVGGCDKGEVASHAVCQAFAEALRHTDWRRDFTTADFQHVLDQAYEHLQSIVSDANRDMATTLTFACFHAAGALVAHIGDSRIYHVRPGVGILYRSEDHSLVNVLVHSGNITPEEAEHHPQSNIITRCVSVVADKEQRSRATVMLLTDLQAGDYLFLCSDGVLESVSDTQLLDILSRPADEQTDEQKCEALKTLCRSSYDNNTAYLVPIAAVSNAAAASTDERADGSSDIATATPIADADAVDSADDVAASVTTQAFTRQPEQARDVSPVAPKPRGALNVFRRLQKIFGK